MNDETNKLIFGKSSNLVNRVVSAEIKDGEVILFHQDERNVVSRITRPHRYWILSCIALDQGFSKLEGKLYYSYIKLYDTKEKWIEDKKKYYKRDIYLINDEKEAAMVLFGFGYFQGLKVADVSILCFDIESEGLTLDNDSYVYIISNTFRKNGVITRKMFSIDNYKSPREMINAWCNWVREIDPSIMCGHNIFTYDLIYLDHVATLYGTSLKLGRDDSNLTINHYDSKFRKDGSQAYDYKRSFIFGREIIDTMFLAYKYDFSRKYPSYGLKAIIKFEGLEIEGRQFYDAGKIAQNWDNLEERKKIKDYACFAEKSSLVSLEDGSVKFIEDIKIGDKVITHDGTSQYVYKEIINEYEGKLFSFNVEGGRKIHRVTPEHPFYVLDEKDLTYKWVKAENLKINHLLVKGEKKQEEGKTGYKSEYFWLFGLFQGDGYVRVAKNKSLNIVITQHCNEVQNLINFLESNSYKFSIVKKGKSKAVDVVIHNQYMANQFLDWSGGKFNSHHKKISRECFDVLNSRKDLFLNFLAGMIDSDGHLRKQKNNQGFQTHMCLVSPHLINLLDLLCTKHSLQITRQNFRTRGKSKSGIINGREVKSNSIFYELTFFKSTMIQLNPFLKNKKRTDLIFKDNGTGTKHVRILKIEEENYKGKVYNISVTNTNSYISNGLVTHNCQDGDDALALYDLMVPPLFYWTQSIPKSFQSICYTATGSQLNAFLVRSYLQEFHGIPKTSESVSYEGAISFGIPGIYRNVFKVDVASLYPSIMLQYEVFDKYKDPNANFLQMVKYFTNERLKNKKLGKETGDRYYKDLEQSQKIGINSAYGMLAAQVNFNSPQNAAFVTKKGREILGQAIEWASGKSTEYWTSLGDKDGEEEIEE